MHDLLAFFSALRVWMFRGTFPVAPLSYINLFRAVYREIYLTPVKMQLLQYDPTLY